MKRKVSGSITIFLAFILIFVMSVVFVFLEVARVQGLQQRAETDSIIMKNSLMSEYNKQLWDEYSLLLYDGGFGQRELCLDMVSERGKIFSAENLDLYRGESEAISVSTWNLFGIHAEDVVISGYGLVTDQNGWAFINQASKAVENNYTQEKLQELYGIATKKSQDNGHEVEVNETQKELVLQENPIDCVTNMKRKGLLELLVGEENISPKELDLDSTLGKRTIQKGTICYELGNYTWKEKILFRQYLRQYFPDYTKTTNKGALAYEMEYLIIGRESDRKNLQGVLNQLLVIREVSNVQYLKSSVEKQELILAAATSLAAATMSPELIPVYKTGITAAWAYAESVSDIRLLLDGYNVALIKKEEQWNTDLGGLANAGKERSVSQREGYDYQQYLQILLWSKSDSVLAYRAMDLIEKNTGARMDTHLYRIDGQVTYAADTLFSAFVPIGRGKVSRYQFKEPFSANYLKE